MIYLALFLLSCLLTYCIKNYARKKLLLDIPNERSSHDMPTPHGGGIAMAITWFMGIVYLYFQDNVSSGLFFALSTGVILCFISFADDVYHIKPKYRLITQGCVALLGLYFLDGLQVIDFGIIEIENGIITNTFAFFVIMWFINLYNFLDGLDGYAGSEAIFLGISGFILFQNSLFLILVASVGGFLVFNWHKAKIFMGDVGSTLLGYNVAIFALYFQNNGTSILLWFILFGLFFFDATLTLFRRAKNKERLQIAHKKHAYQRIHQYGFSHDKVVLYGMGINAILFFLAFLAFKFKALLLFITFIAFSLLYGVTIFVDRKKEFL